MRILGTILAGLLGLAFGSFLNVCLSRWPAGESVVRPRSHCRACGRELAWWENVPVVSWLALRGRCRTCGVRIGVRYVLVELAVGVLWAMQVWHFFDAAHWPGSYFDISLASAAGKAVFDWLLVALAALDAEHFWLPDRLTLPGIALGFLLTTFLSPLDLSWWLRAQTIWLAAFDGLLAVTLAFVLILVIRWIYWLVRRQEGLGLGDAKLMAMLAAWLGLPGALLAFFIGVVLGGVVAVGMLLLPSQTSGDPTLAAKTNTPRGWGTRRLPLGTFLCVGGVVSSLWGQTIVGAYLRWAGF
jgi:leader peptidase (prepilin peptidase) / N-methyltransferase